MTRVCYLGLVSLIGVSDLILYMVGSHAPSWLFSKWTCMARGIEKMVCMQGWHQGWTGWIGWPTTTRWPTQPDQPLNFLFWGEWWHPMNHWGGWVSSAELSNLASALYKPILNVDVKCFTQCNAWGWGRNGGTDSSQITLKAKLKNINPLERL